MKFIFDKTHNNKYNNNSNYNRKRCNEYLDDDNLGVGEGTEHLLQRALNDGDCAVYDLDRLWLNGSILLFGVVDNQVTNQRTHMAEHFGALRARVVLAHWSRWSHVVVLLMHLLKGTSPFSSVNDFMCFEAVGLRETAVAHVALVRFLSRVRSKMSLQFEVICGSVRAVRTGIRFLTGVTPHVTLQLAQFH